MPAATQETTGGSAVFSVVDDYLVGVIDGRTTYTASSLQPDWFHTLFNASFTSSNAAVLTEEDFDLLPGKSPGRVADKGEQAPLGYLP